MRNLSVGRMLETDYQYFEKNFPNAESFMLAADLRSECYALAISTNRNAWQEKRLQEMLACPACQSEPWFVSLIEQDGVRIPLNWIKEGNHEPA